LGFWNYYLGRRVRIVVWIGWGIVVAVPWP
jgi:hypothetical protein